MEERPPITQLVDEDGYVCAVEVHLLVVEELGFDETYELAGELLGASYGLSVSFDGEVLTFIHLVSEWTPDRGELPPFCLP